MKLNKPIRPIKPTRPCKPQETISEISYLYDERLCGDHISIKTLLKVCEEQKIDPNNVHINIETEEYGAVVEIQYSKEMPNPKLKQKMLSYQKRLNKYKQKYAKWKKDLSEYKIAMDKFKKQKEILNGEMMKKAFQLIESGEIINEKELAKLFLNEKNYK